MASHGVHKFSHTASLPIPKLCTSGNSRFCLWWAHVGPWLPTTSKLRRYAPEQAFERKVFFFLGYLATALVYIIMIELLRFIANCISWRNWKSSAGYQKLASSEEKQGETCDRIHDEQDIEGGDLIQGAVHEVGRDLQPHPGGGSEEAVHAGYKVEDVVFGCYHGAYMIFNLDLVRFAVTRDMLSKETGLDYELYFVWELVVLNTHLVVCVTVFITAVRDRKQVGLLAPKLMFTMLPLVGEMFDAMKDTTTGGIYYLAGGVVGWTCLVLVWLGIILPCVFIYSEPATMQSMRLSYWPAPTVVQEWTDDESASKAIEVYDVAEDSTLTGKALIASEELTRPHRQHIAVYEDGIQGMAGLLYIVALPENFSMFVFATTSLSLMRVAAVMFLRRWILGWMAGRNMRWRCVNPDDVRIAVQWPYACSWQSRFKAALELSASPAAIPTVREAAVRALSELMASRTALDEAQVMGKMNEFKKVLIKLLAEDNLKDLAKEVLKGMDVLDEDLKELRSFAESLKKLSEGDDEIKKTALQALGNSRRYGLIFIADIRSCLKHPDKDVISAALNALASLHWCCDEETVRAIMQCLEDKRDEVQAAAIKAIGCICTVSNTDVAQMITALIDNHLNSDSIRLIIVMLRVLQSMEWKSRALAPRVVNLLKKDDSPENLVIAALKTLASMRVIASDPSEPFSYKHFTRASKCTLCDAVAAIGQLLTRKKDYPEIRSAALSSYQEIGHCAVQCLPQLVALLTDHSIKKVSDKMQIINTIGSFRVVPKEVESQLVTFLQEFPKEAEIDLNEFVRAIPLRAASPRLARAIATKLSDEGVTPAIRVGLLGSLLNVGKNTLESIDFPSQVYKLCVNPCSGLEIREGALTTLLDLAKASIVNPKADKYLDIVTGKEGMLNAARYQDRIAGVDALVLMAKASANSLLEIIRSDPDSSVQSFAVRALPRLGPSIAHIMEQLINFLKSPGIAQDVQDRLHEELPGLAEHSLEIVRYAVALLEGNHKSQALGLLRDMGKHAREALPKVADVLKIDSDARTQALEMLRTFPEELHTYADGIAALIKDAEPGVASEAIITLARLGNHALSAKMDESKNITFGDQIPKLLQHENVGLRQQVISGFECFGSSTINVGCLQEYVEALITKKHKSFFHEDEKYPDKGDVARMIDALGACGQISKDNDKLMSGLQDVVRSSDFSMAARKAALCALRDFGSDSKQLNEHVVPSNLFVELAVRPESRESSIGLLAAETAFKRVDATSDDFKKLLSLLPNHLITIAYKIAEVGCSSNTSENWGSLLPYCIRLLKGRVASGSDFTATFALHALYKKGLVEESDADIIYEVPKVAVRRAALYILINEASSGDLKAGERLRLKIEELLEENDGSDRTLAVNAVGCLGEKGIQFSSKLEKLAQDSKSGVRRAVALCIAKLGNKAEGLFGLLEAMVYDMDIDVRTAALWASSQLPSNTSSTPTLPWLFYKRYLQTLAETSAGHFDERVSAQAVVAMHGEQVAREILAKDSPSLLGAPAFRAGALLALYNLPSVGAKFEKDIERLCKDNNAEVRAAAVRAASTLRSPSETLLKCIVHMLCDDGTVNAGIPGDYVGQNGDKSWTAPSVVEKPNIANLLLRVTRDVPAIVPVLTPVPVPDAPGSLGMVQYVYHVAELVLVHRLSEHAQQTRPMLKALLDGGCERPAAVRRVLAKLTQR